MENMLLVTSIVIIAFGVLQIILFFKVWGMTNRVIDIQNLFEKHSKNVDDKLGVLISTLEKMKETPKIELNPNKVEIKQPEDCEADVVCLLYTSPSPRDA